MKKTVTMAKIIGTFFMCNIKNIRKVSEKSLSEFLIVIELIKNTPPFVWDIFYG